jgi:hypothetical protein
MNTSKAIIVALAALFGSGCGAALESNSEKTEGALAPPPPTTIYTGYCGFAGVWWNGVQQPYASDPPGSGGGNCQVDGANPLADPQNTQMTMYATLVNQVTGQRYVVSHTAVGKAGGRYDSQNHRYDILSTDPFVEFSYFSDSGTLYVWNLGGEIGIPLGDVRFMGTVRPTHNF